MRTVGDIEGGNENFFFLIPSFSDQFKVKIKIKIKIKIIYYTQ